MESDIGISLQRDGERNERIRTVGPVLDQPGEPTLNPIGQERIIGKAVLQRGIGNLISDSGSCLFKLTFARR